MYIQAPGIPGRPPAFPGHCTEHGVPGPGRALGEEGGLANMMHIKAEGFLKGPLV